MPHEETRMSEKIIVGIDGSERGLEALGLARLLARATGATLVLASAYGLDLFTPQELSAESMLRKGAEERLAHAAATLDGDGDWESRAVEGATPARALHDLAERERVALIVVGSTHRGPVGRVLPGSVGERLLHGAPCPVAITPRGYQAPPAPGARVVGVGFDGGAESALALRSAEAWARKLHAALRVISVLRLPNPGHPAFAYTSYTGAVEAMREDARRALEAGVAEARGAVELDARLREGDPVSVLAEEARTLDLLLVGSRGYGPLRRVLLGGVSGALAQGVECPLLVVPRRIEQPFGALLDRAAAEAGSASVR
jgi:nucleotide-binding universal stress UspA family protein